MKTNVVVADSGINFRRLSGEVWFTRKRNSCFREVSEVARLFEYFRIVIYLISFFLYSRGFSFDGHINYFHTADVYNLYWNRLRCVCDAAINISAVNNTIIGKSGVIIVR